MYHSHIIVLNINIIPFQRHSSEATVTRGEAPFSGNEAFRTVVTEGFERWTEPPETSVFSEWCYTNEDNPACEGFEPGAGVGRVRYVTMLWLGQGPLWVS